MSLLSNFDRDFIDVVGFKERPFSQKFVLSKMWRSLDKVNDFEGLRNKLKRYRVKTILSPYINGETAVAISGFYCPDDNKVEVYLHMDDLKREEFTKDSWDRFKFLLLQVLCHEFIHMMQFSNRDFNWSERKVKFKKTPYSIVNEDRLYHSNLDEVQAYAHCIFLDISESFCGDIKVIKDSLKNSNCNYIYQSSSTFNMIFELFDKDFAEPVIQKTIYHIRRWANRYS